MSQPKRSRPTAKKKHPSPAVRVSLCMIVRDSSRTLADALGSIKPWVDEMVVVDTGSTDNTIAIAKEHGARVFEFPWCDSFSAARNESLRHARGDWVFWMDSDDVMDEANGQKLRALAARPLEQSPMAYLMQVHCPEPEDDGVVHITAVDHVKMFRNLPEIRFENRIHEQVLSAIRQLNGALEWTDIFVVHAGSDQTPEGRSCKQERDLRLLQLELQDKPDDPFALFNLGMTYADMRRHSDAIPALEQCLERSKPQDSIVRKAYSLLISCYTSLNKPDLAGEICQKGLSHFPKDSELQYRQGVLFRLAGLYPEAEVAFRAALQVEDERYLSSMVQGIRGYLSRQELAMVFAASKRWDQADLQWRLVLEEQSRYRSAWRGLADTLIARGMLATAGCLADQMAQNTALVCESYLVRADICQTKADISGSRCELEKAAQEFPQDEPAMQRWAQFCFANGTDEEAESAINAVLELNPADASAHYNLGNVHARAGRLEESEQSLRQSLALRPEWPATYLSLGFTLKAAGKIALAREAWLAAKRLAPSDANVDAALASLPKVG